VLLNKYDDDDDDDDDHLSYYGSLLFVIEGRAWLYQALSDHLLESYIRCYIDNEKLVKSFYMQDALVLDYQVPQHCRMSISITLCYLSALCYCLASADVMYQCMCVVHYGLAVGLNISTFILTLTLLSVWIARSTSGYVQ